MNQSDQTTPDKTSHVLYFILLGFFWCVGLLGTLCGLKILPGVNPGLFHDFDYHTGLAGIIRLLYDPLYEYSLPIFVTCFLGSLAMAIILREKMWIRMTTFIIAFVPALFPILYLVLWVMLTFSVAS